MRDDFLARTARMVSYFVCYTAAVWYFGFENDGCGRTPQEAIDPSTGEMNRMSWIYLFVTGMLEIAGVAMLKRTFRAFKYNFLLWSFLVITMEMSFYLMSISIKSIPMSTAYAVWTGMGRMGSAVLGIIHLHEGYNARGIIYLAFIIGNIGLCLTS